MIKTTREAKWTIGDENDTAANKVVVVGGVTPGFVTISRSGTTIHISIDVAHRLADAIREAANVVNQ